MIIHCVKCWQHNDRNAAASIFGGDALCAEHLERAIVAVQRRRESSEPPAQGDVLDRAGLGKRR